MSQSWMCVHGNIRHTCPRCSNPALREPKVFGPSLSTGPTESPHDEEHRLLNLGDIVNRASGRVAKTSFRPEVFPDASD